jgi:2-polyprenyl-3-methyl-5-hydroxy-6-metoxy-1,4-benzoquinol methylase
MVHHNLCPLCSSEKISLHLKCTDHFISKEVFGINTCTGCTFKFTQDYPDAEQIGKYYESDNYISHSDTSKGVSNKIYRLVRNLMLNRKRSIIQNVTGLKNGTLLDIGSGTGHFAFKMKKTGWNVKGIEINEQARNFSISKFGLEIFSPLQIPNLDKSSFDCVTLWHVLEHFHDPAKYVSDILQLLKPGGLCFVALPNCSSFDSMHYKQYWAAYDVPRHLWHFEPATFSVFMEKTGFEIVSRRYLPADVFYISILSEKYKGSKIPFFSGLAKALVFTFFAVFRRNRRSSIIYILRKSV